MLAPESRIGFHPTQLSLGVVAQEASAASASGKIRVLVDGIVDPFAGPEGGDGAAETIRVGLLAAGAAARRPYPDQRENCRSERRDTPPQLGAEDPPDHGRRPGGVVVMRRIQIMMIVTASE